MKYPSRMQYVLDAACVIVIAVNLPFAIYGYLLFGSATSGELILLTLALPTPLKGHLSQ